MPKNIFLYNTPVPRIFNSRFSIKFFRYSDYQKSVVLHLQSRSIKTISKMMTAEKRHFDNPFSEFAPHKENHLIDLQTKKVSILIKF